MSHTFKVGDTVYLCYGDHTRLEKKIAKVYANGNFILEGGKQQWKPSYGETAHETGRGSVWSRTVVYAKTETRVKQFTEEHAQRERSRRWDTAMKFLSEQRASWASEDHVVVIEALVNTMKTEQDEVKRVAELKCLKTSEWCCVRSPSPGVDPRQCHGCSCDNCKEYQALHK